MALSCRALSKSGAGTSCYPRRPVPLNPIITPPSTSLPSPPPPPAAPPALPLGAAVCHFWRAHLGMVPDGDEGLDGEPDGLLPVHVHQLDVVVPGQGGSVPRQDSADF